MGSNIAFYRSLLIRRLPGMVVLFLLFTVAGVVAALRLPPTYEATARLIVETPQIPDELAASTVRISPTEEIEFIRQRLFTRNNLIEIQRRFSVLPDAGGLSPDQIVEEMRNRATISSFRGGGTGARGEVRPTLVTVNFEARNGQIAAQVVNEFVTRIIDENVSLRTDAAEDTLEFFTQEVQRLDRELQDRSAAISAFQRENSNALPDDLTYRQGRLALLQERIGASTRERTALIEQKSRIQTAFERTGGLNPANQTRQLTQEERQLLALEAQLRQALTVYSENNPNVTNLRTQIANLKVQIESNVTSERTVTDAAQVMLDLQLSEIDSRIASLDDEIAQNEAIVADLAESVTATPNVAVTLDALNRDYENVRQQYDNAVRSLSQANMGERIELTARGQRMTLIEPATVPDEPSSPNRPLIASAGVGLGLALSVGLFLLLELLNRSIRRPVELQSKLGIMPLATIPFIESSGRRVWRRLVKLVLILAAIAGILGGLYAVDQYYMPLEIIVQRITRAIGL